MDQQFIVPEAKHQAFINDIFAAVKKNRSALSTLEMVCLLANCLGRLFVVLAPDEVDSPTVLEAVMTNLGVHDFGDVLWHIGGWTVGCGYHEEHATSVARALELGYVGYRTHKAPINPEGWQCFELTDAGVEVLRQLKGEEAVTHALKMRQWYRDNAAKYS